MFDKEDSFKVSFDETSVSCVRPDNIIETVLWDDLQSVTLENTAGAANAPGMVWIMWGKDRKSGCVYPGGANGSDELLAAMKRRLSGFDHKAFVSAMNSAENKTFVVWKKHRDENAVNTPE
jgi:hypothetical protein